ncbi:response regulator aspartate phosphatase [Bacillus chungangensis]|uniref:Tetratricopeptide (TPR) repeat protein n=1 Tax=Bacillus chungangensis TaxID=587633 RepID=A0ABT9WV38_9BACI|nr:tetratricopeptide repeat protein [Bacillus chungangensis]MDQ0177163.1 tetratricopeptide (TPR) repeat protein [Bacillus chungangensis]
MTVSVVSKEEITKLLNDWYSEIRSHHVAKAKELKIEIDQKIHRIEEDQDILIYYSLLDFRFQMLTGNFQHDLSLNENLSISEQTETFLQYYYHLFKFIYYTEISHYSKAKKHCEYAGRLLEDIPDKAEKAEFNHRATLFYYYIGDYSRSISHAIEAKRFFAEKSGYEIKLAASLNVIGMSYIELLQFELAEKHLISSLNMLKEKQEKSLIKKVKYNLGLLYSQKGLSELAIKYLSDCKQEIEYKRFFLLAREHYKLENKKEAQAYIEKGLVDCNLEYKHHFTILKTMIDQSSIEQLEHVIDKAIQYFKKVNLWIYVEDYAEDLAIRLFDQNHHKKSNEYFRVSCEARNILKKGVLFNEKA